MRQLRRGLRVVVIVGLVAAALVFGGRLVVSVAGGEPVLSGLNPDADRGGCPGTPNCVSSYAETEEHAIEPIACSGSGADRLAAFGDAIDTLDQVEQSSPTSWIVYSRIMRFPDDVRVETSERGIEVLSASRLGPGDWGVNRNRVEYLRDQLATDERCA